MMSFCDGAILSHNKHAFAYMAITGESYTKCAERSFFLNLKHCHKFYMTESIGQFYIVIGKLSISILNVLIYWALCSISLD